MTKKVDIQGSVVMADLSQTAVDKENNIIKGISILSRNSVDTAGNVVRVFSDKALDDAIQVFEGAHARVDHDRQNNSPDGRGVKTSYGVYQNMRRDGEKIFGDLVLWDCEDARKVMSIACRTPQAVGNSIHAGAMSNMGEDGKEVIESLLPRTAKGFRPSIDLVEDPAATVNLFESKDNVNYEQENDMDWKDISILSLKSNRPDLYQEVVKEGEANRDKEISDLTESRDELKQENDTLKLEKVTSERKSKVAELLQAAKLPDYAVTDTFKSQLMNVSETKDKTFEQSVTEMIEDRQKVVSGEGGVMDNHEKHDVNENKDKADTDELVDIVLN